MRPATPCWPRLRRPCKVAGRDWPFQPATVCSTFSGINWDDPAYNGNRGTDAVRDTVKNEYLPQANADGHFTHPDRFIAGMNKVGNATGNLNGGHIFNLDGLERQKPVGGHDPRPQARGRIYRILPQIRAGLRAHRAAATAPVMGVRDTRRIVGEFELTYRRFPAPARQFPDQVAVYNRPADVHPTDTSKEEFERFMKDMHGSGKLGAASASASPTAFWCRRAGRISGSPAAAIPATPKCTARSARSRPPS